MLVPHNSQGTGTEILQFDQNDRGEGKVAKSATCVWLILHRTQNKCPL
jgi:hypothetical protein